MKTTFNWGTKILILYLSFAVLIVYMAVISMQQKIDLVAPDYYDQELAFQTKINADKNAVAANIKWEINAENKTVEITYPAKENATKIIGTILFFRASDKDKDVKQTIHLNADGKQKITSSNFITGQYIVKIDWTINGVNYFEESNLYLN